MSELSNLSPKEKAQTGIILIKTAIWEVLEENKDRWLRRNQIEDSLPYHYSSKFKLIHEVCF